MRGGCGSLAQARTQVSTASVLVAFAYFIGAVLGTTCLLIPVARATFRANMAEGDFRYLHARWAAARAVRQLACACCLFSLSLSGVFVNING